jgi:hypothetical protein
VLPYAIIDVIILLTLSSEKMPDSCIYDFFLFRHIQKKLRKVTLSFVVSARLSVRVGKSRLPLVGLS